VGPTLSTSSSFPSFFFPQSLSSFLFIGSRHRRPTPRALGILHRLWLVAPTPLCYSAILPPQPHLPALP
jgi:hypothetical protein